MLEIIAKPTPTNVRGSEVMHPFLHRLASLATKADRLIDEIPPNVEEEEEVLNKIVRQAANDIRDKASLLIDDRDGFLTHFTAATAARNAELEELRDVTPA
eukprot:gnl/TRDRNA2_/TRDRNA2_208173_c0_seq1.p1 gnl/TRDRNA2_/TRDRNA2_208173_c0~~gnl/TRDRNA2_/TRDRNA2_208173_c0_seq1.p1  ORF type:complete len:101 (-),score=19.65 gnl/TRDRNA2_/TRDRNA2_208173_c0_seq1:2-304(-)